MAKDVNLTSEKWIELIFEGRNKDYGAYTLRKNSPKRHFYAFIFVLFMVILTVVGFVAYNKIKEVIEQRRESMTEVNQLSNIELDVPEEIPEEQQVKQYEAPPPVELKKTVQFTVPEIKKDEEVPEKQEMKAQEDLTKTDTQISIADVEGKDDDTGIDIADLEKNQVIVQEKKVEEKVFEIVESPPSFPGGDKAMYKFIGDNLVYPPIAEENGISGRVICQFVVGKDGSIQNVRVVRGQDRSLDAEAIRVIKAMPKWIPGKQAGKTVKVKYTLPIMFQLN